MTGTLGPAQIRFVDEMRPALMSYDYTLSVLQTVTLDQPSTQAQPPLYGATQPFRVAGPHLALGPNDLVSNYPPTGSQGDYALTLPHVVLGRQTIPWEIALVPPTPGAPKAQAGPPWMAVLLLAADEIVTPPGPNQPNASGTQTVALGDYLKPPDGTLGPTLPAAYAQELLDDNPKAQVVIVDIERQAFADIAPETGELDWLCHVREVAAGGDRAFEGTGAGSFAVVVGNRLPDPAGGRYVAHLVSVEGFGPYLPDAGGPPAGCTAVRLLSLASWGYYSNPEGADFEAIMENVASRGDVLRRTPATTPDNPTPAQQTVSDAMARGYTGIAYGTRTGEQTIAWYRGPLHPVPMERDLQEIYWTAAAALVYDQASGMFDVSFAAAWETGRLLALANRKFTSALTAWVRESLSTAYLLVERLALFEDFDSPADGDADSLLAPQLVRDHAVRRLTAALAPGAIGGNLGPAADPTRLRDRLDRVPGVLDKESLAQVIAAAPGDPHAALVERLREHR